MRSPPPGTGLPRALLLVQRLNLQLCDVPEGAACLAIASSHPVTVLSCLCRAQLRCKEGWKRQQCPSRCRSRPWPPTWARGTPGGCSLALPWKRGSPASEARARPPTVSPRGLARYLGPLRRLLHQQGQPGDGWPPSPASVPGLGEHASFASPHQVGGRNGSPFPTRPIFNHLRSPLPKSGCSLPLPASVHLLQSVKVPGIKETGWRYRPLRDPVQVCPA